MVGFSFTDLIYVMFHSNVKISRLYSLKFLISDLYITCINSHQRSFRQSPITPELLNYLQWQTELFLSQISHILEWKHWLWFSRVISRSAGALIFLGRYASLTPLVLSKTINIHVIISADCEPRGNIFNI